MKKNSSHKTEDTQTIIAEDVQEILRQKSAASDAEEGNRAAKRDTGIRHRMKKSTPYIIVSYAFVFIFVGLIAYLVYFNVALRDGILSSPYNKRQDSQAQYTVRGSIESADGKTLAKTETDSSGKETRSYPYANEYAHVVGYASNGKSGIESVANYDLLTSHNNFIDHVINAFNGTKDPGDTVVTTLNSKLQDAAYQALGDYQGAVLVMDPKTGAILAMVSKPDFDPNTIAADWNEITGGTGSQLLNRATQGKYPPGSIFKIVTSLAYFRKNATFAGFSYDCKGEITVDGHTVHCFQGEVHGQEDFTKAFAESCNCAFSQIGLDIGADAIGSAAKSLLFNQSLPCDLAYNKSSFTLTAKEGNAALMQTAFGQGDTLVTPYSMALIVSAIANNGVLMKPYLISSVKNTAGVTVSQTSPSKYASLMTATESSELKKLMEAVVTEGTASSLQGEDYTAAGKTGSADYKKADGTTGTHSWFVGFTNPDDPDLAIAVLAEGAGSGSGTAVPIAHEVFNAYYNQ